MNKQLPQVSIVLIPVLLCCFLLPGLLRANKGTPSQAGMTWADKQDVAFNWREISSASALGTPPDNDTVYTATLPFTFYYYNQPFTTLYISSNGMISFHFYGGRSFPTNDNLAFNGGPDSLLAVFWDNLEVVATSNYNLYTKVEGTAPYRRFIVEYLGFQRDSNNLGPLTFQVIFFETTNLIKFQYLELQEVGLGGLGSKATIGLKYSGQGTFKDSLLYSFQQNVLSDSLAILFYPAGNLSASASINPVTIQAGTNFQQFTYRITNLTSTADSLKRMGKADVVRLANFDPSTTMLVTGVKVDGHSFFIKNENSVPTEPGFATWYYDTVKDSLYINFPSATVVDSVSITYLQTVSTTPATHTVNGHIFNRLHPAMAASVSASFTVTAASVARYSISPSRDTTTVAGSGLAFTLNAFDAFDNPVPNSGSAVLVAQGSGTALFSPNDTLSFAGGSSVGFTVSDTVAGSFTIRASAVGDSTVNGVSGVVTVQNGPISRLTILSSQGNLVVGSHRVLQVELRDRYGNIVADSLVTFTRLSGDGQFSNGLGVITVTSSSAGVAQAEWTGSTQTGFVSDSIQVRAGSVQDTIVMPLVAGSVSHYDFTPATAQTTTAGTVLNYILTARDLFGNSTPNTDRVALRALNGTGVTFSTDTLDFAGNATVAFTIQDTVAETFFVKAEKVGNAAISGQSAAITVNPGAASNLTEVGGSGSVAVGSEVTLKAVLKDAFGNLLSDSSVVFKRLSGGNGTFKTNGLDSITVSTGSDGIAQVVFVTSSSTSFGTDSVLAYFGTTDSVVFVLNLLPGEVSYLSIQPSPTVFSYNAGDTISLLVKAFDVFGNLVTSSTRKVTLSASSGNVQLLSTNPATLAAGQHTFTVRDTVAESGVTFTVTDTTGKSATTAAFTINPSSLSRLIIRGAANNSGQVFSGKDTTLTADQALQLFAAGYDRFGNFIADIDSAGWTSTGQLSPAVNSTGKSVSFAPARSGVSGRIRVQISGNATVASDSTGLIQVTSGALASVRIQLSPDSGGTELADRTLVAGDTLTLYAAGYDADFNFLGLQSASWKVSPGKIGKWVGGDTTFTGTTARLVADTAGNGTVSIAAIANSFLTDVSGVLTVTVGPADHIVLRNQANNGGQRYDALALILSTDTTLLVYAAHYDSRGNFVGDLPVTWSIRSSAGNTVPSGSKSFIAFVPTSAPDTVIIFTTSSTVTNDSTANIVLQVGQLSRIAIRNTAKMEVDTLTLKAGQRVSLLAAGFDAAGNFLGNLAVTWSDVPDSLGNFLLANPTDSNVFEARKVGAGIIKASTAGGLSDQTSTISILAGDPFSLLKDSATDSQSTTAGSLVPRDIRVQVKDAFGNPASGVTVQWSAAGGGSVSPANSLTNALGFASTSWTTHAAATTDSVKATVPGFTTSPDTVTFYAFPLSAPPDQMMFSSARRDSGTVLTVVGPFAVKITDSLNNPVPNAKVTFQVSSIPSGATGYALSADTALTNNQGIAQTNLTLGNKLGTYRVSAISAATPSRLDFFGVADTPLAPSALTSVAGNSQTDTVAQALPVAARFQLTDAHGNPVAGKLVRFEPLGGGSVQPASATTDSLGQVATTWTLGNTVGSYRLRALYETATDTLISDTLLATAVAGKAAQLQLVSIRDIAGTDSVTVLPTFATPFTVKVLDAFGNRVPSKPISFQLVGSPNAILSTNAALSDSSGQVSGSVTIDPDQDVTTVEAVLPGVDTLKIHLFQLRYVAGSLSPVLSSPGKVDTFQIAVKNPGPHAVLLDTSASFLTFTDGTNTFKAFLQGPDSIPATALNWALTFLPGTVPVTMVPGSYQPQISLKGRDADASFQGQLSTEVQALKLVRIEILSVSTPVQTVRRGEAFQADMTVRNPGGVSVVLDTSATQVVLRQGNQLFQLAQVQTTGIDTVAAGQTRILRFTVQVPTTFTAGAYQVDGLLLGTETLTGSAVGDSSAVVKDSLEILKADSVSYLAGTLGPLQVTTGDSFQFTLQVKNTGPVSLVLNASQTFLKIGTASDTAFLAQNSAVGSNQTATLAFQSIPVTLAPSATAYPVSLFLKGDEGNASFVDSLVNFDSVTVQQGISVLHAAFGSDSTVAGQGEGKIPFQLVVTNNGVLNAPMVIQTPQDVTVRSTSPIVVTPTSPASGAFPVTLNGGQSQTFQFQIQLPDTFPAGVQKFWGQTQYQDGNSGKTVTFQDSLTATDQLTVLTRAQLQIASLQVLGRDTVSQGQSGVQIQLVLRNTGQVAARVGVDSLSLSFLNQHTLQSLLPSLPKVIAGGAVDTFLFTYSIAPQAALGPDPVSGTVLYRDGRSNAVRTVSTSQADTLFIQSPAGPGFVSINSLNIPAASVNRGQAGIAATVKLTNLAQATARVDTVEVFSRLGGIGDTLVNPGNLMAGASASFNLQLVVADTAATGNHPMDVRLVFTDMNSGVQSSKEGAVQADTLLVQQPARAHVHSLVLSRDTASVGQTGLTLSAFVKNTGEASLALTAASVSIVPDAPGFTVNRVTPVSLPTLSGGDSVKFIYSVDVKTTALAGLDTFNLQVTAQDLNDNSLSQASAVAPATLQVQSAGQLVIDSVRTPLSSATIGQSGIPVQVYFRNPGQAGVRVSDVSLFFNSQQSGFFVALDSLQQAGFFNGSNVAYFSVEVLSSAPTGSFPITARVQGEEQNTGAVLSDSSTAAVGDTLVVTQPAGLQILSVQARSATFAFDSVSIGDTNIPVTVRVKNTGGTVLLLDTLQLTFTHGQYAGTDSVFNPALALNPGSTASVAFQVDVLGTSTPGLSTLNATASGRDQFSGRRFSDSGADTTDSWRLVTPASLVFQKLLPSQVSVGQQISLGVRVQNTGQATAHIKTNPTVLNFGAENLALLQPVRLPGNQSDTLNFQTTVINLPAGTASGTLFLDYTENGFARADTLRPIQLSVFDSALVTIQSIDVPDTASQDQTVTLNVTLANSGASRATAAIDSVVIPELGISRSESGQIVADGTLALDPITFSLATAGLQPYTIQVYWHDVISGHANRTQSGHQILILKKATLEVLPALTVVPDTVVTGQTIDTVQVAVRNTGQVSFRFASAGFTSVIGVYAITPLNTITRVAPGDTVFLMYRIQVASTSAVGRDSLNFQISGTDSISQASVQAMAEPLFTWVIQRASILSISSVNTTANLVSQGQQGVPVSVVVSNQGGTTLKLVQASLIAANGSSNYTGLVRDSLEIPLPANTTTTLQFLVNVKDSAALGVDFLNARAVAVNPITGDTLNATGAVITESWTVQQRPRIQVTSVVLAQDTLSKGQGNVLLTVNLKNNGGTKPTALAGVDSLVFLINNIPNDTVNLHFRELMTFPISASNNASVSVSFFVEADSLSASGNYRLDFRIHYVDLNDSNRFTLTDVAHPQTITIQQPAELAVAQLTLLPDTASVGQENVVAVARIANRGEAGAELFNTQVLFSANFPFTQTIQSPLLPTLVSGQDTVDVQFLVDLPPTIPITGFQDTLVALGVNAQYQDVNSSRFLTISRDSVSQLSIVTPPHLSFVELGPQTIFNLGDTVSFVVKVVNLGGARLQLDSTTVLSISGLPDALINVGASTMSIAAAETATVVFKPVVLSQSGSLLPMVTFKGTSNLDRFSQVLNTEIISVGGNIAINRVQIVPEKALPGQGGLDVFVRVSNAGPKLKIDSVGTGLAFEYVDNGEILPAPVQRIDGLDSLRTTLTGDTLHWKVSVPATARIGKVTISAELSFNDGTILVTSLVPDTLLIQSNVKLAYASASLTPDSVVAGQVVAFSLSVLDSGNTDLIVDPDSTFLKITDGPRTFMAPVSGTPTILGTTTSQPRATTLTFLADTLPATFTAGARLPLALVVHGNLPNGQRFEGDTLSAANQLSVLQEASVVVDSIQVVPASVTRGQTFVVVHYFLRNEGESPAQITQLNSVFRTSSGNDVSGSWLVVFNSVNIPFVLAGGDTLRLTRKFNVLNSAPLGENLAFLTGSYADVRKPFQVRLLDSTPVSDSVTVIQASQLRVEALQTYGVPNPPFVNYGQPVNLRLTLNNLGDDPLDNVAVRVLKNDQPFIDTLIAQLPGNTLTDVVFSFLADSVSATQVYRAVIDSAVSHTTGKSVFASQPVDNVESITIQRPSQLSLAATVSDSTLSLNQLFQVGFQIQRVGGSPFGFGEVTLRLPGNYRLDASTPDSTLKFTQTTLSGQWTVVTVDTTPAGTMDSLRVFISLVPLDSNQQIPVQVVRGSETLPVQTTRAVQVVATAAITSPAGAVDGVLSTGQAFVVKDTVAFLGAVSDSGRTAEIQTPSGYLVQGATLQSLPGAVTRTAVSWTVVAPGQPSTLDTIIVLTRGLDRNTGLAFLDRDTLVVTVQERAQLNLAARLVAPSGALDGVLSTGQPVDLRVAVNRQGQAATLDSSRVVVNLPAGYRFGNGSASDTLTLFENRADTVRFFAALQPGTIENLEARFVHRARDENTGLPADTGAGSVQVAVQTVARAALAVSLSMDSVFSTNQGPITATVKVTNQGTAAIVPSQVWVRLDTGPGTPLLALMPGDSMDHLVVLQNNVGETTYQLRALNTPGRDSLFVSITDTIAQDENNNFLDSLAYRAKVQDFQAVQVDSAGNLAVQEIRLLRADSTRTDTLSTGQTFQVVARVSFSGSISPRGRQARLFVPPGFAFQQSDVVQLSASDTLARWVVTAPDSLGSAFAKLGVRKGNEVRLVEAPDGRIEGLTDSTVTLRVDVTGVELNSGDTLLSHLERQVVLEERARLNLSTRIASPAGAVDGIVSTGQTFQLALQVTNVGGAPVTDSSTVRVSLPAGFQFNAPGSGLFEMDMKVATGPEVQVTVVAPDTATLAARSIRLSFIKSAMDVHTGLPAAVVAPVQTLGVTVVRRAELEVSSVSAEPDSVTRNQLLNIDIRVRNTGIAGLVPDDSVWVQLVVDPQAWQAVTPAGTVQRVKLQNNLADLHWVLRAQNGAAAGLHVLKAQILDSLSRDENSGQPAFLSKSADSTQVTVLAFGAPRITQVLFPQSGLDSLIASTQQDSIVLQARMAINPLLLPGAVASIVLPPGFAVDQTQKPVGADSTVRWWLTAPPNRHNWESIKLVLKAESPVNPDSSYLDSSFAFIQTETRATLALSGAIIAPAGATDDTVSYGQQLVYQAVVENLGEAQVLPAAGLPQGAVGQLRLNAGSLLQLSGNTPAEQPFAIGQPVTWTLQVDTSSLMATLLGEALQLERTRNRMLLRQAQATAARRVGEGDTAPAMKRRSAHGGGIGLNKGQPGGQEASQFRSEQDRLQAIQERLAAVYREIGNILDTTSVQVVLSQLPLDENTGQPAFASQPVVTTSLVVQEKPFVRIDQLELPGLWSTNQIDTVRVGVAAPPQVVVREARIILPAGFEVLDGAVRHNPGRAIQWLVRSPREVGNDPLKTIRVEITGRDRNSGADSLVVQDTTIRLQKEATLALSSLLENLRLSRNQKFSLTVQVENRGEAGTVGSGQLRIDSGVMRLQSGETAVKSFTLDEQGKAQVSWQLQAPDSLALSLIKVNFVAVPKDANKGTPAALDSTQIQATVGVSVLAKRLLAVPLKEIRPAANYRQGDTDIPVLGLMLSNPEVRDFVFVDAFFVSLVNPANQEPYTDLANVVTQLRVERLDGGSGLPKGQTPPVLAQVTITEQTPPVVPLIFFQPDTIAPQSSQRIVVKMDLAPEAPNRNFQVRLNRVRAFQIGLDTSFVDVTDSVGNPLQNLIQVFSSPPISVVSSDPTKIFGNYPNPFGEASGKTKFVFFMEQDGDVDLRIYNLLGELVWKTERQGLQRGLYDGAITWDGTNGRGQKVLNGVYVAVLRIKYVSGGGQTLQTKVAFIK